MVQTYFKDSRAMKFTSDIDIDVANRDQALALIKHVDASIIRDGKISKHNTGAYFTEIPVDPFTGRASLDYEAAEKHGYIKIDILNVGLYQQIRSDTHLQDLMSQEPLWDLLQEPVFCSQLIHIGAHYDTLMRMPEPVDSIPRLAMFLAIIRPAKRHLIGCTWKEIAQTVWERPTDDGYYFKKAHAVGYAHLVAVNMNLICEQVSYEYS
jgi:hypothetical protein